ncbi:MAG: lipopolysaccharide heptosyltransferase II [Candidatus Aureabacteria bacterium]|nr:lipopolysaccharide heptosyltransferase II [Candidatus Auribacterota bacterium]
MKKGAIAGKKILLRAVNWIGDAVMMVPSVNAVKKMYPDAEIAVLGRGKINDVLSLAGIVDRFIKYDIPPDLLELKERVKLAREIKAEGFSKCFVFPNSFDSALVPYMAGIPERIGFGSFPRIILLSKTVKIPVAEMHQAQKYFELVKADGFSGDMPDFNMAADEASVKWAETFLSMNCRNRAVPLVGISPGAEYGPAKRWFPDRFASLINRIKNVYNAEIILLGSKNDMDVCGAVKRQVSETIIDTSGKTTIKQLAAILKKVKLLITNDTGTMHLAAALQTPVLAIFGSTDAKATSPVKGNITIIRKETECSPCLNRICHRKTYECFSRISVDEVFGSLKKFLGP